MFFSVLFICLCLYATDLETIIQSAIENSDTVKTLEINRQNTELSWQSEDIENNSISINLETGNISVKGEGDGETSFSFGPSVEVTLPETDNGLSMSFGMENSTKIYTSGSRYLTLDPSVNLTKEISTGSFTDTREEITKLQNRIQQNLNYQKSLLEFKNDVINSIIDIIEAQTSLSSTQLSYDRAVTEYNNDIICGSITKDSVLDLQAQMKLESQKVSLDNQKTKLQNLLNSFKQDYGTDYEMPQEIREADLTFEVNQQGNTSVQICGYSLETARQNLEAATGNADSFTLALNADTPFTYTGSSTENIWTTGINGNVSATMTASNYSLGAYAGANYEYNHNSSSGTVTPYITVYGSWTNDTDSESSELEIQTLKNKVILAQMEYEKAVEEYKSECKELQEEIDSLKTELSQFEVSVRYNSLILEQTLQMYEEGLSTKNSVEDAQRSVEEDETQRIIYSLQALLLENKIAILQL